MFVTLASSLSGSCPATAGLGVEGHAIEASESVAESRFGQCASVDVEEFPTGVVESGDRHAPSAQVAVQPASVGAPDVAREGPPGDVMAFWHEHGVPGLERRDADERDLTLELSGELGKWGSSASHAVHHDAKKFTTTGWPR